MFLRLLLLFTLVPLVELYVLLRLGSRLGVAPTILLVIVTGVVGAQLARREGVRTLRQIQERLQRGVMPTEALIDGALIVAAGLLLVTPGVLTDAVGFGLLFPLTRVALRRYVRRRLEAAVPAASSTVEVEFTRRSDESDAAR